ncbi:MAG: SDR family NAD(P)-dependent oxidoreductase [Chrysiogenales bacterium]|nr:MAG: SDR family NAD(P)-dependent oxidoreductase [Chrysiogenales bacterium]
MKRNNHVLTALVTGASSGLGESIAKELASRGHTCLLISENLPELERVKQEIIIAGRGKATTLAMDLFKPDSAERIFKHCLDANIEVDILVNCAGIFLNIDREMRDIRSIEEIINLHILSLTKLCFLFGRPMLDRHRGWILNISSIASGFPDPASLTYGPTKRYILSFSEALHCEWKDRNVAVTCLTPGGINTNFFTSNEVFIPSVIRATLLSPDSCAKAGINAMFRGKARITPGISGKVQAFILGIVSRPSTYGIIRRSYCSMKKSSGAGEK